MITLILEVTSKEADISEYNGLLDAHDELIVICRDDSTIEAYNEAIKQANEKSDILFLSDTVTIYDGFIKNMKECLNIAEKHAIVCAQEIDSVEDETIRDFLPMYSFSTLPTSYCALIKRVAINNFGYLDTRYDTLLYALIDFHFRVNIFGFSTIVSHHAMFSEKKEKDALRYEKDVKSLNEKYDYSREIEKRHNDHNMHPCLRFKDLLINDGVKKKRILFDCNVMPPNHCGTTEYQISLFESFCKLFKDKYDIFMYVTWEADKYHGLSEKYGNIVYPDNISGVFHIGFVPNQIMFMEMQYTLNKHCLKIVQTMYDIMMIRIDEHLGVDVKDVELGTDISDGLIFISNFSKNDFDSYFGINKPVKVIYPASSLSLSEGSNYSLPFEEYFLIVGNSFKHKAVKETLAAISHSEHNYIVIGQGDDEYIGKNVYGYLSGQLSADFLSYLYANCKAVIFPSQYEGFGLPIATGLKNKKRIIASNNELNNELREHFQDFKDYFIFFENFSEIEEIVDSIDFSKQLPPAEYKDSWDNVAIETESFFEEILNADMDIDKLSKRWLLLNLLEEKQSEHIERYQRIENERFKLNEHCIELEKQNNELTRSVSYRLSRKISSWAPVGGLYKILKKMYKALRHK
ncbi:MAG: glycosyltransferase [Oscillospiraceae bacterium]|nr:glycosyltransferase [Oscillospiraceae bacterium]MCL2278299.1 glycosyltransferase [Oscillospiraceae bacterium]